MTLSTRRAPQTATRRARRPPSCLKCPDAPPMDGRTILSPRAKCPRSVLAASLWRENSRRPREAQLPPVLRCVVRGIVPTSLDKGATPAGGGKPSAADSGQTRLAPNRRARFWEYALPEGHRRRRIRRPVGSLCEAKLLLWEQLSMANRTRLPPFVLRPVSPLLPFCRFARFQKKPVMSHSYPQSTTFVALALYCPSSGVQSTARTCCASDLTHSPGTGHLELA